MTNSCTERGVVTAGMVKPFAHVQRYCLVFDAPRDNKNGPYE